MILVVSLRTRALIELEAIYGLCNHSTAMDIIEEACYSRFPVGISLHVSIFPTLAVLEIHFMAYRSSQKSNLSVIRP